MYPPGPPPHTHTHLLLTLYSIHSLPSAPSAQLVCVCFTYETYKIRTYNLVVATVADAQSTRPAWRVHVPVPSVS